MILRRNLAIAFAPLETPTNNDPRLGIDFVEVTATASIPILGFCIPVRKRLSVNQILWSCPINRWVVDISTYIELQVLPEVFMRGYRTASCQRYPRQHHRPAYHARLKNSRCTESHALPLTSASQTSEPSADHSKVPRRS